MGTPNAAEISTIDHLIRTANQLEGQSYAHKLIRSYLLTKSRNLIFENNDKTQLKYFDASEVCKRCSLPWKDGNLSLQLKQMKMTKRKALKVRLLQEDKSNAKKQKLAKRLSKKANNVITIKCDFCKDKNQIPLWKTTREINDQKQRFATAKEEAKREEILSEMATAPLSKSAQKKLSKRTAGLLLTIDKTSKQLQRNEANAVSSSDAYSQSNQSRPKQSNANKKKASNGKGKESKPIHKMNILALAKSLKKKQPTSSSSHDDKLKKLLS